jgi:HD-like signal output (HDOD) protein
MRMPEMDGYEFLQRVRKDHPRVMRVMFSGYSDKETILKAVEDGTVKAYLTKPWDNAELLGVIIHLLQLQETLSSQGLLNLIARIDGLPELPSLYNKILSFIQGNREMSEIAQVIQHDPSSVAKILKIANSSFYGMSIGTIKQAVIYLGLSNIKNIILSSEVFEMCAGFDEKYVDTLWAHSSLCNRILHHLHGAVFGSKIKEEFGSIGLLHDIGALLMIKYFPVELGKIRAARLANPQEPLVEIERRVLGVSHDQLGGYLLDWWNLPSHFSEACLFHHTPDDPRIHNMEIIALLHIADAYSWAYLDSAKPCVVNPAAYAILGTDEECMRQKMDGFSK